MKNLIRFFIINALIFFSVSCEVFFPSPLIRFNPDDPDTQIKNFAAVSSGADAIVTAWEWTDPSSNLDSSQIFDKIRIVHKREGIPDSPFPLDGDDVKEFSDKTIWSWEWKGLKSDRDHYFVIYAHEKDGGWLKLPRVVNRYLNPWGASETGAPYYLSVFYVDRNQDSNGVSSSILNSYDVDDANNIIGFISFNTDYNVGMITSARLTGIDKFTNAPMDILPLRVRIDDGMTWGDLNNPEYYDYSHAVRVTINANTDVVDITDIMNLARLYESNTIVFIAVPGSSASYDLYSSTISYDYWRQD